MRKVVAALALALAVSACSDNPPAPASGPFAIVDTLPVGGSGHWDYVTYDPSGGRLYLSHNHAVEVVDVAARRVLGPVEVRGFSHGVAIVPGAGRGYVTVGTSDLFPSGPEMHAVVVFDLKTRRVLHEIFVKDDPDGIVYDPVSNRVVAFTGETHSAAVIDPTADRVVGTIDLPSAPGGAIPDGTGHLYVGLPKPGVVVVLDPRQLRVVRTLDVPDCRIANAVALDAARQRLFVACRNRTLVVLDARTGAKVADVPIARHNDAAAFDPATRSIFVSTLDGTLSIVRAEDGDRYQLVENLAAGAGARTLALDPVRHRVYLAGARFAPLPLGAMRFPDPVDGTFGAVVVGASR
ncbi:MAG TPA: YncE family protein [Candidatus Elarobacter sp.]